jgi:hypothetical protein
MVVKTRGSMTLKSHTTEVADLPKWLLTEKLRQINPRRTLAEGC